MEIRPPGWLRVDARLVAVALLVASIVVLAVAPEPSWWHVGYPLDAAAAKKDSFLAHPAPGAVVPMSLFALSGLATWRLVWPPPGKWWRLGFSCALAQIPFGVILQDQATYDSMFGSGHGGFPLILVYGIAAIGVYCCAIASLCVAYPYVGARWLGCRLLKVARLEKWWNRAERTRLEFATEKDALAVAQEWADANGAVLVEWEDRGRGYERLSRDRNGVALSGLVVTLEQSGDRVRFEAGIVHASLVRLMTLGAVPLTMPLASGGFADFYGRRKARAMVNPLLKKLGGPQIE